MLPELPETPVEILVRIRDAVFTPGTPEHDALGAGIAALRQPKPSLTYNQRLALVDGIKGIKYRAENTPASQVGYAWFTAQSESVEELEGMLSKLG